jgi:hypothetical protein
LTYTTKEQRAMNKKKKEKTSKNPGWTFRGLNFAIFSLLFAI